MAASEPPTKKARTGLKEEANDDDDDAAAAVAATTLTLEDKIRAAAVQLKEEGYAVVEGVCGDAECDRNKAEMMRWISKTTQGRVQVNDSKTWTSGKWVPHTHFIVQHYGVGHQRAVWNARTNLNAIKVFAELWGTDKLTVSYDGANLWKAPEDVKGSRWPQDNVWLHVDQTPYSNELECVQSWVTFEEVDGEWDATLMVVPKSHLLHKDLATKHGIAPVLGGKQAGKRDMNDWYKFTPDELEDILGKDWKTEKAVCVSAPKGSMVLWDSRTFHQARAPLKGRPVKRDRALAYLCYGPEKWMTDAMRRKKRDAATNNRTTTHWPLKSKLFDKTPRTYGAQLPDFDIQTDGRDDTDPVVRKLCCFDGYGTTGLLGWKKDKKPLLDFVKRIATPRKNL